MKLRHQTFLAVLPLFLLLALAGNGIEVILQSRVLRKGFEAQAVAIAVALSENLRGEPDPVHVAASLERLHRWEVVQSIRIWDTEGVLRSRWDFGPGSGPELPDDEVRLREHVTDEAHGVGMIEHDEIIGASLLAGAVIYDDARNPAGWLETRVLLTDYEEAHRLIVRQFWRHLGVTLMLGLGVAWGVAWFISREVRALAAVLGCGGAEDYEPPQDLRIGELSDLGATFGVLGEIHREAGRRNLLQAAVADRFHSDETLAEWVVDTWMPPSEAQVGGRRVAARVRGGREAAGYWQGIAGDAAAGWLFFGCRDGASGAEGARRGCALVTELTERLQGDEGALDPAGCLNELGQLYAMRKATVVGWRDGEEVTRVWRWDGVRVEETRRPWEGGDVFSLLSPDASATMGVIAAEIRGAAKSAAELVADVDRWLEGEIGVMAVILPAEREEIERIKTNKPAADDGV